MAQSKPALSFCSRRPPPPYTDLVAAGVSSCQILGPWHEKGRGVRYPITLTKARDRADALRERGIDPELIGWSPVTDDGLDEWLDDMARWQEVLAVRTVWADLEPVHNIGSIGWRMIRDSTPGRMLVTGLRARCRPGTRIGVTHVQGPASEGIRAALEAADLSAPQTYDGDPAQDARRLEQVASEMPHIEVCAFMPAGFKAGAKEATLRRYVPGVLAADAELSRVILWPDRLEGVVSDRDWRKRSALPPWIWGIYREHTAGRLMCGPGAAA